MWCFSGAGNCIKPLKKKKRKKACDYIRFKRYVWVMKPGVNGETGNLKRLPPFLSWKGWNMNTKKLRT